MPYIFCYAILVYQRGIIIRCPLYPLLRTDTAILVWHACNMLKLTLIIYVVTVLYFRIDFKDTPMFTCNVIHNLTLMSSVVQVLAASPQMGVPAGEMLAIGHTIGLDQIPSASQVYNIKILNKYMELEIYVTHSTQNVHPVLPKYRKMCL